MKKILVGPELIVGMKIDKVGEHLKNMLFYLQNIFLYILESILSKVLTASKLFKGDMKAKNGKAAVYPAVKLCWKTGRVPKERKCAAIVPLHKRAQAWTVKTEPST